MYAKIDAVKVGDVVVTDDGFTCIKANKKLKVQEDNHGLYITCGSGHHYIDGQLNENDEYVGLTKLGA